MKISHTPGVFMTVDPGLGGTGYATWSASWELLSTGILRSRKETLQDRCDDIANQLSLKLKTSQIREVYVEFPAVFGSAGGQVTAGSGALVKLVILVGWISCTINRYASVEYVKVNSWKGQLPKDVVWARILKKLPGCKAESHALDAVGIGLHVSGRM